LKVLVIQTAFIGDVVLATPVIEKLHRQFPEAEIDFLLRKGNETLFTNHPFLHKVLVWDKRSAKQKNLFKIIAEIRQAKYDMVINLHRFASSGMVTWLSGSPRKFGFDKNPFSFCYTTKVKHEIGNNKHEVERNLELIASITDTERALPHLYPQQSDYESVAQYKTGQYLCIAPSSVWFTKQLPEQKWIEFLDRIEGKYKVYLIGAGSDSELCDRIINATRNKNVNNLAGKLSFLQSAALMKDAVMNYVNDSAPMHIASAVNAPVTAVFCSTIPAFGFGPLSEKSCIVETTEKLDCRPCGLHGYKACPKGHFKCAFGISVAQLEATLQR
jgi:lipopolysaccharide heptosyltransferase II